jgi:rhamnogalacturonyl hydrolase YesR
MQGPGSGGSGQSSGGVTVGGTDAATGGQESGGRESGGRGDGGQQAGGNGAAALRGGAAPGGNTGGDGGTHAEDITFCRQQLDAAAEEYDRFRSAYTDPTRIPRSYQGASARLVSAGDWTSGFVAGSFWYLFEHTGEQSWKDTAQTWTQALYGQRLRTSDHDIGFVINNTYGNGLRLTGDPTYAAVLETAASSAVSRYEDSIGAIRSWDYEPWTCPVIIDNMMNLELLFRATELGGDSSYRTIAVTHALTTVANHFRPDGSSFHVVDFDPDTGNVIARKTAQGVSDDSAWARGQAWGLYGFTMTYRETGDVRFLSQAQLIADFYTQHGSMPEDGIPYFDFSAPDRSDVPDHRDASAGAIAASALFELAAYVPEDRGERYRAFALKATRTLSSSAFRAAANSNGHFLLLHSVGNYPQNDEIDVGINYADYYYLEALTRCVALE